MTDRAVERFKILAGEVSPSKIDHIDSWFWVTVLIWSPGGAQDLSEGRQSLENIGTPNKKQSPGRATDLFPQILEIILHIVRV